MCGQGGHLKKQCPQLRRGKPVESREQNPKSINSRTTTNYVTSQNQESSPGEGHRLRKELLRAELEEALVSKTATLHVLKLEREANEPVLGPTISVEVLLEGHPVKALVDTKSPITILSINCFIGYSSQAANLRSDCARMEGAG